MFKKKRIGDKNSSVYCAYFASMRKIILSAVLLAASSLAFAQGGAAGLSSDIFSFRPSGRIPADLLHLQWLHAEYVRIQGGAFADFYLFPGALALESGILYQYGSNQKITGTDSQGNPIKNISDEEKISEHAIQVPLYLRFSLPIGMNTSFTVFGGPSLVKPLSTASYYSTSADVTIGGGAGFTFSMCTLQVGYEIGLTNRYASSDASCHRNALSVGVSFVF